MEDNHRLMTMISTLKIELKDVRSEFDSLFKSVKLLTSKTQSFNNLLSEGKIKGDKKDLGFSWKSSYFGMSSTIFFRAFNRKNKSAELSEVLHAKRRSS